GTGPAPVGSVVGLLAGAVRDVLGRAGSARLGLLPLGAYLLFQMRAPAVVAAFLMLHVWPPVRAVSAFASGSRSSCRNARASRMTAICPRSPRGGSPRRNSRPPRALRSSRAESTM